MSSRQSIEHAGIRPVQEPPISDIMPAHPKRHTNMAGRQAILFSKYHGLGNDFLVIDTRNDANRRLTGSVQRASRAQLGRLARSICDRHTWIGADGLLLL